MGSLGVSQVLNTAIQPEDYTNAVTPQKKKISKSHSSSSLKHKFLHWLSLAKTFKKHPADEIRLKSPRYRRRMKNCPLPQPRHPLSSILLHNDEAINKYDILHTWSNCSWVTLPEKDESTSRHRSRVINRSILEAGGQGCAAASRNFRQSMNSVSKASSVQTSCSWWEWLTHYINTSSYFALELTWKKCKNK